MGSVSQHPVVNRILQRIKWIRARLLIKSGWEEEAILRMELIDLNRALLIHTTKVPLQSSN